MDIFSLSNLIAWNLQIALLAIAGTVLPRVLTIDAPLIRHAYWRTLLLLCLLLPFLQTWHVPSVVQTLQTADTGAVSRATSPGPSADAVAAQSFAANLSTALRTASPSSIAMVLGAGIAVRCAWLAIGIARLRRMRRSGATSHTADRLYDDVAALVETRADVRRVPGLGHPVTFGVWRPTVLLPDSYDVLPEGVRRAVLAHELWHVRRRDWAWLIAEECVRAAFWFNPAISWLVAQVQRSREEVVDELTIQLTNSRRTYLETLLRFADEGSPYPAAPIASRRHLLQRMLLISKEARMSPGRIVGASMATMLALIGTIAYGASSFPFNAPVLAVESSQAKPSQSPPRDRRPTDVPPETTRERTLKQQLAGASVPSYLELAKLQEERRVPADAESTLLAAKAAFPNNTTVLLALGLFYVRADQLDKSIATFEEAAAISPVLTAHLAHALSQKASRLEMEAGLDAANRVRLQAAAAVLRDRVKSLAPPPPPPPPPPSKRSAQEAPPPPPPPPLDPGWPAPLRVGGNIKPPVKIKDVKPVYPQDAQEARVQGVVILEATIDPLGRVHNARVLRGQPMLDEAALDAVKQWEYSSTEVNGVAVPVIMTVTVNFALQPQD